MKQFLLKVISSGSGISSKRTVGAITYIILTLSIIVLAFINPNFILILFNKVFTLA